MRIVCTTVISVLLSACAAPRVSLKSAAIVDTTKGLINSGRALAEFDERIVSLRIEIVSEKNLYTYFKERGRFIQVRCYVEREDKGRSYEAHAIGPFQGNIDISRVFEEEARRVVSKEEASGHYEYRLYTFMNLVALHKDYTGGSPVDQIDLRTTPFKVLSCSVVGVTMAPAVFFRWTNSVEISAEEFRELLRTYDSARAQQAITADRPETGSR